MDNQFYTSIQVIVFVATFILALIAGPIFIPLLRRLKFGQTVRDDGPSTHLKKTGTPTIGGVIFLIPILLVALYCAKNYPLVVPLVLVTLGFGIIGFIDDFIKVVKKRKDGLDVKQKTLGLLFVANIFSVYVAYGTNIGVDVTIPFYGTMNSVWFFIPFTILFLYATTNSVNLTDGLDGLLGGITLIVLVFFTIVAMTLGEGDVKVFSAIVSAGWLNLDSFMD